MVQDGNPDDTGDLEEAFSTQEEVLVEKSDS